MTLDHNSMLMLCDASSFIFRDYHSAKSQDSAYTFNDRGEPIGALKRFTERCYWWRRKGVHNRTPSHFAMVFDYPGRTFRHALYQDYKAHRPEKEADLRAQMPLFRDAAEAVGLCCVEQEGYEADDLLATYSLTAAEQGADVLIISGDKDLLQLVGPGVAVFDPPCGVEGYPGYRPARLFHTDEVIEKFGVPPELVVDVQALSGDPGDGVPGVPGIGPGKAAKLIQEYGSLDAVLAAAPAMAAAKKPLAMWRNIAEHAELARISRRLCKLDATVDYATPVEAFLLEPLDHDRILDFADRHGLDSVTRLIRKDQELAERRAYA